ncbi:MAG: ABC transporter permease subunit [Acidimicrobiia bacterium]
MADPGVKEEVKSPPPEERPSKKRGRRTLWMIIGLLAAFVVYAYAYQATEVSLDKITDETRQEQLFRVLRALARPDLLTYERTKTTTDLEFAVPCPADGFEPAATEGEADFEVDPNCAEPREQVVVKGTGFIPNDAIQVFFVPPNGTELRLANVRTDSAGAFQEQVRLPNRPDDQVQTIRVISRQPLGSIFSPKYVKDENGDVVRSPRWSENAKQTLNGIIETVFLALLATTAGTIIAIPLSFFAARNLMRDVRIPAIQLGLAVAAIPVGVIVGLATSGAARDLVERLPASAWLDGFATILLAWITVRLLRVAVPPPGSTSGRLIRIGSALLATMAALLAGQTLARFAELSGSWFAAQFGGVAFLGDFVATNGEILAALFGVLAAIAGAAAFALLGSRLGYVIGQHTTRAITGLLGILAAAVAGAIVAVGFGQVVAWLYQIVDTRTTVVIPAIVGAILGALVGWIGIRRGNVGAGMGVYYMARTVYNTLRSIEPLIMAIVFVIWVGLGPFAGSFALGLHTVAGLAKLYSEQVESINPGPVEAVRATGATRLQTVVYGVVPQIIAPYISFTMYRWDINVRMSTIIGFVGGGGIGFILQQNISLLNYRAAAAQMLAIAIVVATMDYVSSRLRERYT